MDRTIGRRQFTVGTRCAVFEDADARQYVVDDEKAKCYGT
jgi:hypothetical protein